MEFQASPAGANTAFAWRVPQGATRRDPAEPLGFVGLELQPLPGEGEARITQWGFSTFVVREGRADALSNYRYYSEFTERTLFPVDKASEAHRRVPMDPEYAFFFGRNDMDGWEIRFVFSAASTEPTRMRVFLRVVDVLPSQQEPPARLPSVPSGATWLSPAATSAGFQVGWHRYWHWNGESGEYRTPSARVAELEKPTSFMGIGHRNVSTEFGMDSPAGWGWSFGGFWGVASMGQAALNLENRGQRHAVRGPFTSEESLVMSFPHFESLYDGPGPSRGRLNVDVRGQGFDVAFAQLDLGTTTEELLGLPTRTWAKHYPRLVDGLPLGPAEAGPYAAGGASGDSTLFPSIRSVMTRTHSSRMT